MESVPCNACCGTGEIEAGCYCFTCDGTGFVLADLSDEYDDLLDEA